jgi:hypothetical protein
VYSLEYPVIPKAFFMPHQVEHCYKEIAKAYSLEYTNISKAFFMLIAKIVLALMWQWFIVASCYFCTGIVASYAILAVISA